MGRLAGKSILVVIPKDYYCEEELDPILEIFKQEEPAHLKIASAKFKEAVGMKKGRITPDLITVDAMEGITGDSYVDGAGIHGTRKILAVYQAVVIIGGKGAKRYLWEDKILKILVTDRFRCGAVIGAIGTAVPCLGKAGIIEAQEVTTAADAKGLEILEAANAVVVDDPLVINDRIITAKDASVVEDFAHAIIESLQEVAIKQ